MAEITLTAAMRSNLLQLQQTDMLMNRTQSRIATGRKVNSALDNPTAFFQAKGLTDNAKDLAILKDTMGQSVSTIQSADKAITAITELVEQAKALANSAKSTAVASERSDLATQFDDLRAQIDKLAGDATYTGKNLVAGRGTVTGGTFTSDKSTVESALTGVAAGGITVSSETSDSIYAIKTFEKVQEETSVQGTGITAQDGTSDFGATAPNANDGDTIDVVVTDESGASVTTTVTITDLEDYDTTVGRFNSIANVTATFTDNQGMLITAADGFELKLVETGTNSANIATDLGVSMGYQTGTDVSTALGVAGGTSLRVWVDGYTDSTNATITLTVSGSNLLLTDGTNTTTVAFSDFATDTSTNNDGTLRSYLVGDVTVKLATTGDLTSITDTNTTTVSKNLDNGDVFRIKITSSGQALTKDVTGAAVSYTDSAWGATIGITATEASMVAGETSTLTVSNPTGIGANDLKVVFNAAGDASINVKAVDTTSSGLSISATVSNWANDANIDAAITEIDAALKTLRTNTQSLSTNLSVIQTREDFTNEFINTLEEGADKLTLADGNQEATNMLMLQTRQQLGIQALSMASQSAQAVLLLFR